MKTLRKIAIAYSLLLFILCGTGFVVSASSGTTSVQPWYQTLWSNVVSYGRQTFRIVAQETAKFASNIYDIGKNFILDVIDIDSVSIRKNRALNDLRRVENLFRTSEFEVVARSDLSQTLSQMGANIRKVPDYWREDGIDPDSYLYFVANIKDGVEIRDIVSAMQLGLVRHENGNWSFLDSDPLPEGWHWVWKDVKIVEGPSQHMVGQAHTVTFSAVAQLGYEVVDRQSQRKSFNVVHEEVVTLPMRFYDETPACVTRMPVSLVTRYADHVRRAEYASALQFFYYYSVVATSSTLGQSGSSNGRKCASPSIDDVYVYVPKQNERSYMIQRGMTNASMYVPFNDYTVKRGDALERIIRSEYGLLIDNDVFGSWNGLQNINQLSVGQILTTPSYRDAFQIEIRTKQEWELLRRLAVEEAGSEVEAEAMKGVLATVRNRIITPEFPDTITGVICQLRGNLPQYDPVVVHQNMKSCEIPLRTVTQKEYEALLPIVDRAIVEVFYLGDDPTEGATYFKRFDVKEEWMEKNTVLKKRIGNHEFRIGKNEILR